MSLRIAQLGACVAAVALFVGAAPQQRAPVRRTPHKKTAAKKPPEPPALPCGDYVGFQVPLDRQGFSTGEIDGKPGPNLTRAISAMQTARKLTTSGQPDCDTWHALGGDHAQPALMDYTLSDDDVKGPFTGDIPRELAKQASLPSLGYRTPLEMIAERFHTSPALLRQYNIGIEFTAGRKISVPAVTPFLAEAKPATDALADDTSIEVSKEESALRATRADGSLVFYAPVTTGSEHDPLPLGDWKVLGLQGTRYFTTTRTCSGTRNPKTRAPTSSRDRTTRLASCGSRSARSTTACMARRNRATSDTPSRMAACG